MYNNPMNYKILIVFVATGCISLNLGLRRINISKPEYYLEPVMRVEETAKPQSTGNEVYSSNIILWWPYLTNAVSISNKDMDKLIELAKTDPKKFDRITKPTHKVTNAEIAAMINEDPTIVASAYKNNR